MMKMASILSSAKALWTRLLSPLCMHTTDFCQGGSPQVANEGALPLYQAPRQINASSPPDSHLAFPIHAMLTIKKNSTLTAV